MMNLSGVKGDFPLPRIFDVAAKQYGVLKCRKRGGDEIESDFT